MSVILTTRDGKTACIETEEGRKEFLYGMDGEQVGWYKSDNTGTHFSDGGFLLCKSDGEKYADWHSDDNDDDLAEACAWLYTTVEQLWGFHMILRHKKTYDALNKNYPTEAAVEICNAAQELAGFVHTLGKSIGAAIREAGGKTENSKSEE